MRKLLTWVVAGLLATAALSGVAPSAGAAVLRAADLAADCNHDGLVNITENTRYVGGSADVWGFDSGSGAMCLVDVLDDGLSVTMTNVNLRAKGDVTFNIGQRSDFANTSVIIRNSTIDMHPPEYGGGFVSIKSGCCSGASVPVGASARVTIVNSNLRGTAVELGASLNAPDGWFSMSGSRVEATGDAYASVPDIEVIASETTDSGGRIELKRNELISAGGLSARTGERGTTWVERNDFSGVVGTVVLSTGAGGTCSSVANTPAIACT